MTVPHFFRDEGDCILNRLREIDHIAVYHRRDVWSCPHCGWGDSNEFDVWFKTPYIKEVHIQSRLFKLGHVVIVSRCPKCREISWIHYEIDNILQKKEFADLYPEDDPAPTHYDYDIIKKERDRLWSEEQEVWDNSLCKTCKHRTSEPFQSYRGKYSISIDCEVIIIEKGMDPWTLNLHGRNKEECKHYIKNEEIEGK